MTVRVWHPLKWLKWWLVDQPLAEMLILERSRATAFQRSLNKWASRGMISHPCHIRENRIVEEQREQCVNCPHCQFTTLQAALAEGFAGWGSSQDCARELMVIPGQVGLSSALWHRNDGECLRGWGYLCVCACVSSSGLRSCPCGCEQACANVHSHQTEAFLTSLKVP